MARERRGRDKIWGGGGERREKEFGEGGSGAYVKIAQTEGGRRAEGALLKEEEALGKSQMVAKTHRPSARARAHFHSLPTPECPLPLLHNHQRPRAAHFLSLPLHSRVRSSCHAGFCSFSLYLREAMPIVAFSPPHDSPFFLRPPTTTKDEQTAVSHTTNRWIWRQNRRERQDEGLQSVGV